MGDVTLALHVLTSIIGSLVSHLRPFGTEASPTTGPARVSSEIVAPNLPCEVELKRREDERARRDANVAPPPDDPNREGPQHNREDAQNRTEPIDQNRAGLDDNVDGGEPAREPRRRHRGSAA